MSKSYTLKELASIVDGELHGDGDTSITGVAGIREAQPGEITFLADPSYKHYLGTTAASAVVGPREMDCKIPAIQLPDPYLAFVTIVGMFANQNGIKYATGVHEKAVVDATAKLGKNVSVGAYCHIGPHAEIGDDTTVVFGVYIGHHVKIGAGSLIYPNVTIREMCEIGNRVIIHPGAVIGADGFGFVRDGGVRRKIPHIGNVVIEDDVEIGANTTVDRATTGATRIGAGTKIDNLVQIGHNVKIGKNSVFAGQSGVSGSAEIGNDVVVAGQAGVVPHITIGDGSILAAKSGATKSVPAGSTMSGFPAREHTGWLRLNGFLARIPGMRERIQELEKRIDELEKKGGK